MCTIQYKKHKTNSRKKNKILTIGRPSVRSITLKMTIKKIGI